MLDPFGRNINYLRISVTDRCNLRCTYCMPAEGVKLLHHIDILTFDEIVEVVTTAVEMGVTKVRITGGEPLVRKGIVTLVGQIAQIKGITDLSMTTNGVLLSQFAADLKQAGLQRINISLDTVNPLRYRQITRIGEIGHVLCGIDAAIRVGFSPIKINCVIQQSPDEPDAKAVSEFCRKKNLPVRYIYQMDLAKGEFSGVLGGDGGQCHRCNRIRLSADGNIMPCLFSELKFNIRQLGVKQALIMAVNQKPKYGIKNLTGSFYNIGG